MAFQQCYQQVEVAERSMNARIRHYFNPDIGMTVSVPGRCGYQNRRPMPNSTFTASVLLFRVLYWTFPAASTAMEAGST